MLDLFEYESQICPGCGGHYSQTRDTSLSRDVKDVEDECLDCAAIATWREALHSKHCKKDACVCHKRAVWVDGYGALPGR